jgi:transposase-like protein
LKMALNVRKEGLVRSRIVMLAYGVNTEGCQEFLGLMSGDSK